MARAFFRDISSAEAKTKIPCNKLIAKPKSGYRSHIETYHKDTMVDVSL